ncbi:MAG TPA: DEAD/DEAH box helicase family protein, partial [Methylomirabilota bacterium]|nr:DEAD/DEAH box helicase family protein [Methylomirabilota bacterium]
LTDKNVPFAEEDKRSPIIAALSLDLSDKLKQLKLIPRDYQERIVNIACAEKKGIVRAATGSGKTLVAALITAQLNKPTTIYVIGLDLLKQFHDLFSSLFDEPIGFIGNGVCQIERINIASVWTIGSALRLNKKTILSDDEDDNSEDELDEKHSVKIVRMLQNTNVHLFDESHVITTNTIKEIFKTIDPEYIYGLSGTPFRDDNSDLLIHGILGEKIVDVSASELIAKGVLVQPTIKFVSVPPMSRAGTQYQSVYKNYIVENNIRNSLIVEQVKMLLDKKYTPLVLFKQIKHGKILSEMMDDAGIKHEMLYGNDSLVKRTKVKESLVNREIDVLLASVIYDMGIDIPMLNALVLCGGGKSTIRSLQRIGRVIRSYPGKKFAAVIDFYDQVRFLKLHSLTRRKTYQSEPGFKVVDCKWG